MRKEEEMVRKIERKNAEKEKFEIGNIRLGIEKERQKKGSNKKEQKGKGNS